MDGNSIVSCSIISVSFSPVFDGIAATAHHTMTLFTFASRQIWPQVLGWLHLQPRPERLVLFHTDEEGESAGPAKRLRDLFSEQGLLPISHVEFVVVPHDSFGRIIDTIASTAERHDLDGTRCRFNLTGGNKLMAMAGAEWCRLTDTPAFYLERDLKVFPFQVVQGDLIQQESYKLDPHLAKSLEPLGLLRCQLGNSDVVNSGQQLTLNDKGRELSDEDVSRMIRSGEDLSTCLLWDVPETKDNHGFALEYATAVVLLRLGVPVVQRSIRLIPKVSRGSGLQEGELDLVFNWAGKLWVVDCKDRRSAENRVGRLRQEIQSQGISTPRLEELLNGVADELRERDLHPLKEDLLAVAEVGGLLGKALCVRSRPLPVQALEFANSRGLDVVLKDRLIMDLRSKLFPNEPASMEQLKALASVGTRATS